MSERVVNMRGIIAGLQQTTQIAQSELQQQLNSLAAQIEVQEQTMSDGELLISRNRCTLKSSILYWAVWLQQNNQTIVRTLIIHNSVAALLRLDLHIPEGRTLND